LTGSTVANTGHILTRLGHHGYAGRTDGRLTNAAIRLTKPLSPMCPATPMLRSRLYLVG
jgi:hypothetical protein